MIILSIFGLKLTLLGKKRGFSAFLAFFMQGRSAFGPERVRIGSKTVYISLTKILGMAFLTESQNFTGFHTWIFLIFQKHNYGPSFVPSATAHGLTHFPYTDFIAYIFFSTSIYLGTTTPWQKKVWNYELPKILDFTQWSLNLSLPQRHFTVNLLIENNISSGFHWVEVIDLWRGYWKMLFLLTQLSNPDHYI